MRRILRDSGTSLKLEEGPHRISVSAVFQAMETHIVDPLLLPSAMAPAISSVVSWLIKVAKGSLVSLRCPKIRPSHNHRHHLNLNKVLLPIKCLSPLNPCRSKDPIKVIMLTSR